MAASDQINKTLTKEIRNLKLKQYIPFSVKLNASITDQHKRWSRWIFLHLSYIAGYSLEAAPKQSQRTFLLRLTWSETAYKTSSAISR